MVKKAFIKLVCVFMSLYFCLSFGVVTKAQSIDSPSFIIDAATGWDRLPGNRHMGTKYTSFKFQDYSQKHRFIYEIEEGIKMWGDNIDVEYDQENGLGTIVISPEMTGFTAGAVKESYYSDTGHVETWTLTIYENYYDKLDRDEAICTIAHEIGHVYGLGHVNDSTQIMYHASGIRTVTSKDVAGMDVMTHEHTHEVSYSIYHEANSSIHKNRCNYCLAYVETSTYEYDGFMHTLSCSHCLDTVSEYCDYTSLHSGNKHYYYFDCICGNNETLSWLCPGNPCVMPYSVKQENEIE